MEAEKEVKPRPIGPVLEAVFAQIPLECGVREDLRLTFISIINSTAFAAPEMMKVHWHNAMGALQSLGDPKGTHWKEKIAAIMIGAIDYRTQLPETWVLHK